MLWIVCSLYGILFLHMKTSCSHHTIVISIPLFHCITSTIDGNLNSLQLETIKNNVAINILVQTFCGLKGAFFLSTYLGMKNLWIIYIYIQIIHIHTHLYVHIPIYAQTYKHTYTCSVLLDTVRLFSKCQILDKSISRGILIYFTHFNYFIFKIRYRTKGIFFLTGNCSVSWL